MRPLILLYALSLVARASEPPVTLTLDGWKAAIDPNTMTVRADVGGREFTVASGSANPAERVRADRSATAWRIPALAATFRFEARGHHLRVRVESDKEQTLEWPRTGDDKRFSALILPEGEGLYVPVNDTSWAARLGGKCLSAHGQLSMPFWSFAFGGGTFTYQLISDIQSEVCISRQQTGLRATASNAFRLRDHLRAYELEMWPGGASPIAPALEYREGLIRSGSFVSLADKIRINPMVERLLGAIHMYVWGDGRTPAFLADLHRAGIHRALISYDQNERARTQLVGREFITAAKAAGYLVGPYDTYANAQDPVSGEDAVSLWPGDLFPAGCILNRDLKPRKGFAGRGCELSSEALEKAERAAETLTRRLTNRLKDGANAYFLDVDAFGELYDDYSPAHPMSKAADRENRLRRMRRIRERGVVLGSEEGAGWSVPVIDFAHGALSVQNAYLWPKKKEFGGWWPPDRPRIFFQRVVLDAEFISAKYDPAYRLPLYETVFHSSVVATDRWDVPLAKFPEVAVRRQLLELLYGVPSIWAMDRRSVRESQATLTGLAQFFEPLHKRIGTAPLESFTFVTADRLVQRTTFGKDVVLTANFGSAGFTEVKPGCIQAQNIGGGVQTFCPKAAS
jgi:hypothetical protein